MAVSLWVVSGGVLFAFALDYVAGGVPLMARACPWRLGLVALALTCSVLLQRSTRRWHELVVFSIPSLGLMGVTEIIGQLSPMESADRYMFAAIICTTALLIRVPIKLETAVGTAVAAIVCFPVVLHLSAGTLSLAKNVDLPIFAVLAFTITILSTRRSEIERRTAFLQTLRHEILALDMARLNAELARLSATDPLTGIANRRYFDDEAAKLWEGRGEPGFGIAFIDVDLFKSFNDTAGHDAGDLCLRRVARAMAGTVEDPDVIARYGGEEFVVLLSRVDREATATIGERLRLSVEMLAMPHPGQGGEPVTISVGVAWWSVDDPGTLADLLHAADQALYAAKRAGRNRVALAAPSERWPMVA